jgi:hypothetical protein
MIQVDLYRLRADSHVDFFDDTLIQRNAEHDASQCNVNGACQVNCIAHSI